MSRCHSFRTQTSSDLLVIKTAASLCLFLILFNATPYSPCYVPSDASNQDQCVHETAWDILSRRAPEVAKAASRGERRILKAITPEQADALANGADLATITLADGRTVVEFLQRMISFDIAWWTVDGGGGASTGGTFELSGTIGQTDAATLTGDTFAVSGGFWGESAVLFLDGFETGDITRWSATVGASNESAHHKRRG